MNITSNAGRPSGAALAAVAAVALTAGLIAGVLSAGVAAAQSQDGAVAPSSEIIAPGHGRIIVPIRGCKGPVDPLPTPPPTPVPIAGGPSGVTYQACPQLTSRVPNTVLQYALANPHAIGGYGVLRNPNVREAPWNQYRSWLSLRDMGKPYNKCNSVVWKAGCP